MLICLDIHRGRGIVNSLKSWTDYLFPVLDGVPEYIQVPVTNEHIVMMMASSSHSDIILEEDEGIYEKGDTFKASIVRLVSPCLKKPC